MDQLIPFVLKSMLLSGGALLVLRLLRGMSASARSVFAHFALIAMIAMPVADMVLPSFSIPLPAAATAVVEAVAAPAAVEAPVLWTTPLAAQNAMPMSPDRPDVIPIVTAPQQLAESIDWVVLAYALPTLWLLCLILLGTGRLFRLRSRAQMLTDPVWLGALDRVQTRMGLKHDTALRVSDDISSPISWGLIRPVVLLDRQTLALDDRAEAIITHELAHILRFDWTKLMLARVATALYWFNPLVWLLAREAQQLREETADDAVLATRIADTDYAALLVRTARAQIRRPTLASAGGMAHGMASDQRSLARRVQRVLDAGSARGPATLRLGIGIMVGTFGLALPLAALSFEASEPSMAAMAPRPTLVGSMMKAVTTATQQSARMIDEAMGMPSIAAEAKEPATSHATYVEAPVASVAEAPAPHHAVANFAAVAPSPILPPTAAQEAVPFAAQSKSNAPRVGVGSIGLGLPFAPQTKSDAPVSPRGMVALPGTQAALRRHIESLQKGQPNFEEMTPEVADAVRQELPGILRQIEKWGALKSIGLTGGSNAHDTYYVRFEHGGAYWQIARLTPDGKVQGMAFSRMKTLLNFGIRLVVVTRPYISVNVIPPRAEQAALRHIGDGNFEVAMPGLADVMGRNPEKFTIRFSGNVKNGLLHVESCRVKQSSGDTDVDLIPCQALTYCAVVYGTQGEDVRRNRRGLLWPSLDELDRCLKPRMEAMVADLHGRRGRASDTS